MAILCDQQTGKIQLFFQSRPEPGSGPATGKTSTCHLDGKVVPGTRALIKTVVLFFSLIFALGFEGFAQKSSPSEYQIKAAFLYNFAKFVEWPPQAFTNPQSPIVIGVLGKNVFGDDLERTIHNKTVNHHPFLCEEIHSVREATNCQILFISASEKTRLPKILKDLRGKNILTVSETDQFIQVGGMINFVIEDDEIHFQINDDAAKRAGLKISSKLLSLAVHNH
jgi:hypothetical protein